MKVTINEQTNAPLGMYGVSELEAVTKRVSHSINDVKKDSQSVGQKLPLQCFG